MERQRPQAEPYRIKMVEPIRTLTPAQRRQALEAAGYNPFRLRAEDVAIDLLTDSGTNAMSDRQWSAMMLGDEAYAGSRNWEHLLATVQRLYGFEHVIPAHQGRAAENALAAALIKPGAVIPCNSTFVTTQVHFERHGAKLVNVIDDVSFDLASPDPFKGNLDLDKLETVLRDHAGSVPFVAVGMTVNAAGGQPVSLANVKAVAELAGRHGVPVYADGARAIENAWFIQSREPGWQDAPLSEILAALMAPLAGVWVSGKKDAFVNIGGFLAMRDRPVYLAAAQAVVNYEGLHTYGGLAGRDLAAMAVGIEEAVGGTTMAERIRQVAYLGEQLANAGLPVVRPFGGHGVYLDGRRMADHLTDSEHPALAIAAAVYLDAGVRVLDQWMPASADGTHPAMPLVRLAVPRRVYTDRHLDVVAESLVALWRDRSLVPGLEFVSAENPLRFYTSTYRPV
jgi:tyrosine phenol-lyase